MPELLSEKIKIFVARQDHILNKKLGYDSNDLLRYINALLSQGTVEVGWREACGATDTTALTHRAWQKVVKLMEQQGFVITRHRQKHPNGSPTRSGGFWNSIIYSMPKVEYSCEDRS